jgi:acyl-CoA thioesterase
MDEEVKGEGIKKIMLSDSFRKYLGAEVEEFRPGYARVRAVVKKEFLNFHGVAHGGFVISIADFAFAIAGNADNIKRMALNININFYSSAKEGDVLIGEAERITGGKRVGFYELRVSKDDSKEIIAKGTAIVYGKGDKFIKDH